MFTSIALLTVLQIVAPGVKLGDPVRVADFTYGAVREAYLRTELKIDDGFRVITASSQQIATDVDASGTPDLATRTAIGPVFGPLPLRQCGATECFNVILEGTHTYGVMTDVNGNALTDRFPLPDFPRDPLSISSIVPDPDGFAYVRIDRGHFVPARAVRIDLSGRVVYDVALRTFEPAIRYAGHYVEIGTMCALGACDLVAGDLSATGDLGPARTLYANNAPQRVLVLKTLPVRVALVPQTVTMLRLDNAITTATVESHWNVPFGFGVVDLVANQYLPDSQPIVLAVLARDAAIYTTLYGSAIAPRLLSYGARPQTPLAIANDLAVWSEHDADNAVDRVFTARQGTTPVELGNNSVVYNANAAPIGADVLVCWGSALLNAQAQTSCAIVHTNGSFDSFALGAGSPKPIVALADAWIVARASPTGIAANRVTTSGFVYPPLTFRYEDTGGLIGVASDGQNVMLATALATYVMTPGLGAVRRVPHDLTQASAIAFSGGSYLLAGAGMLYRMNPAGEITSARRSLTAAVLAGVHHGWLVCSSSQCARVFAADPPVPAALFDLAGVGALTTQADDRVAILTTGNGAIELREIELFDQPRRRAVQH